MKKIIAITMFVVFALAMTGCMEAGVAEINAASAQMELRAQINAAVAQTAEAKATATAQAAEQMVATAQAIATQPAKIEIGCAPVEEGDYLSLAVDRAAKKLTAAGSLSFSVYNGNRWNGLIYSVENINAVTATIYPGDEICVADNQGLLQTHNP